LNAGFQTETSYDSLIILWTDVFVMWKSIHFRMVGGIIVSKDLFTTFVYILI